MSDSYDSMPPDAADGFSVYLASGQHSITKTAELLGKSRGTVASWSHRYQWKARAKDITEDIARGSVEAAVLIASAHHSRYVELARQLAEDSTAKWGERMEAIKWLAGIGGLAPKQRIELDRGAEEAKGEALAVADLAALAAAGNMALLIAIAQGRTPAALPASTDPDVVDLED